MENIRLLSVCQILKAKKLTGRIIHLPLLTDFIYILMCCLTAKMARIYSVILISDIFHCLVSFNLFMYQKSDFIIQFVLGGVGGGVVI